ncbi:ribosome recycling factor [Mycoplasmopsis hyopharyngis]|uniref:ribosome recycling factor n=1 Tax=Mycoplasmopsis hyopharyngis TaxID=29558 RepID=UPI00387300C2
MELDEYIIEFLDGSEKVINHLKFELSKISTGRANPNLIRGIRVNYYDTPTLLEELSSISVPEAQQLLIKPYDLSIIVEITKALQAANLGVNAINEGDKIRMTFPSLTTERRKEMVKNLSKITENSKIGIRNIRQDINKDIKNDESLTEDDEKRFLEAIQKEVDKQMDLIAKIIADKEKELMTI